ncbi:MAG: GNAT family protein [Candidatus Cloacimonetes bacterium]|nr:GNAT family protein [Candidatus Cloacimonadota bacterium]
MSRIYLRALEPEDYTITIKWRNDEEITKALGGNHFFVSQAREKIWVEDKSLNDGYNIYLAICLREDGKMIGFTSINNIDCRNLKAEWGGTIIGEKDFWGKGYATEAAKLMLDYLFEQYPMHKCYGYCLEDHKITEKMLLSLGFTLDGLVRDDVYKDGEFKSKLLFSILKEEYVTRYSKDNKQSL